MTEAQTKRMQELGMFPENVEVRHSTFNSYHNIQI